MVVKVENGLCSATYGTLPSPLTPTLAKSDTAAQSSTTATDTMPGAQQTPAADEPATGYREFCGNAKRITVETNCQHLRIVGNDNRIFVHRNVGRLEVLGNANRVRVLDNRRGGRISYVGNGGRVYVCGDAAVTGKTVSEAAAAPATTAAVDVRYTGINGSVRLVSREELLRTLAKGDEEQQQRRQQRRKQQQQERNSADEDSGLSHRSSDYTSSSSSDNVTPATGNSSNSPRQQQRRAATHQRTTVDDLSATVAAAKPTHFQRSLADQLCVSALNVSLGNLLDMDVLSATIRRATTSDLVINQLT